MKRHIQEDSNLHSSNTDGNKSRIFRKTEMVWKKNSCGLFQVFIP